ncbi:hypothetical protein K440DRAFT_660143 [Wilcoxina mikolae CBS 423.85]|nr:hypothetical protein K440DRAFT_660143 [Wilcoxina mikolae CBS 423.85]
MSVLYTSGGYHPVHLGDRFNDRYVVEHKLGSGSFSTVWLAGDHRCQRNFRANVPDNDAEFLRLLGLRAQPQPSRFGWSLGAFWQRSDAHSPLVFFPALLPICGRDSGSRISAQAPPSLPKRRRRRRRRRNSVGSCIVLSPVPPPLSAESVFRSGQSTRRTIHRLADRYHRIRSRPWRGPVWVDRFRTGLQISVDHLVDANWSGVASKDPALETTSVVFGGFHAGHVSELEGPSGTPHSGARESRRSTFGKPGPTQASVRQVYLGTYRPRSGSDLAGLAVSEHWAECGRARFARES